MVARVAAFTAGTRLHVSHKTSPVNDLSNGRGSVIIIRPWTKNRSGAALCQSIMSICPNRIGETTGQRLFQHSTGLRASESETAGLLLDWPWDEESLAFGRFS